MKRMKPPEYPLLEKPLITWVSNALAINLTITGFILIDQSQEFTKLRNISNFRAPEGWLTNFKRRANLR